MARQLPARTQDQAEALADAVGRLDCCCEDLVADVDELIGSPTPTVTAEQIQQLEDEIRAAWQRCRAAW